MMNEKIEFKTISIGDLGALISQLFKKNGMEAILVGGSCVSIYTKNQYQSYDLDFVSYDNLKKIQDVLKQVQFYYDSKKYFKHEDCPFFVEFLSPPVAVGDEPISTFETRKENTGTLILLTPTDCVKDRLAAFYHWDDKQCLEQAVLVATAQDVNIDDVKKWSIKEKNSDKYDIFIKEVNNKASSVQLKSVLEL